MNIALFDFDGTISHRDSFLLFMQYMHGKNFWAGSVSLTPKIALYILKIYPNYSLKRDFLHRFFKGYTNTEIEQYAQDFCDNHIPCILRSQALKQLHWHQQNGDTIAVVSACPEPILKPWCEQHKYTLLATQLEFIDTKATGLIDGKNCWGEEKVVRIESCFNLREYDQIYAYGDSQGDKEMLALADHPSFKPFRE